MPVLSRPNLGAEPRVELGVPDVDSDDDPTSVLMVVGLVREFELVELGVTVGSSMVDDPGGVQLSML